jgi:hypothetical protein
MYAVQIKDFLKWIFVKLASQSHGPFVNIQISEW